MSISLPKRVEELSPLEIDDNLKTPMRHNFSDSSSTKTSLFPKRISELSPLESSDDENECNQQNRDPLNDSFVCTPSSKLYSEIENNQNAINSSTISTAEKLPTITEANGEGDGRKSITSNRSIEVTGKTSFSRQLKFSSLSLTGKEKPQISLFSRLQNSHSTGKSQSSPLRDTSKLKSPSRIATRLAFTQKAAAPVKSNSFDEHAKNSSISNLATDVKRTISAPLKPFEEKTTETTTKSNSFEDKSTAVIGELSTPTCRSDESNNRSTVDMLKIDDISNRNGSVIDETPYKPFQIPSTRRVPSTHRSILSSNTMKKCRSALENEFRSQKVLFTTPSAVSRAPILLSSLGLDDSLHCYKSSPVINNQIKKDECNSSKIHNQPKVTEANAQNDNKAKIDPAVNAKVLDTSNKENKEVDDAKILRINGKDFIIRNKIGQGGSSSVFLAEHKDSKLECAVKVVDLRGDPALIEGYVKEVKILASLQDKVNVIRLYEYALVSSQNLLYMVMEKGDSDLRKILQTYKTSLPLYTLMNFWHQMLQAVSYIHKNDVIHSDLKPENFLMVNGRLKLIDFGISSKMAVDATSIIKYSQVGTFNYISPEALMDTSTENSPMNRKNLPKIKISTKSDVWSLGCILYLLLYKKTPFAHIKNIYAKMQAITDPAKQIDYPTLPNYYPSMLIEMAQQCLKHNPKQRVSVAELLNYPFHMVIPLDK